MLRRYALLNFLAVTKVVKKHDKLSLIPLRNPISAFAANQPFHTGLRLLDTYTNMRAFIQDLVAMARGLGGPQLGRMRQCTRCSQALSMWYIGPAGPIGQHAGGRVLQCGTCLAAAVEHGGIDLRYAIYPDLRQISATPVTPPLRLSSATPH